MKESPISDTWKDIRCGRCDTYIDKDGYIIDPHFGPNCSVFEVPNHQFTLTADQVEYLLQKKYQGGELNGATSTLLDLELKARHEPELTTFEVDRIVGFIDFYKSQLERKEQ